MQKNFSSKKRCTIFCDNFFSHDLCDEKLFCQFFFIHAFLRVKKYRKKSIHLTCVVNLFFVIETVLHFIGYHIF